MALRDLLTDIRISTTLQPAARVNGTANGLTVDLRGYDSACVAVIFGTWTDGTHTPSLQHSSDGTSWANVAASEVYGVLTPVASAIGGNSVQNVGYLGSLRYLRVVLTTAGATSGALSYATVINGNPRVL